MPQGVKNRILRDPDSLLRSIDGIYELRTKGNEWQILCDGKPQEYLEYGYDFFRLNFTYEQIKQAMPMYLDEIAEGNGPWPDPEPPIIPRYSPGPWKILDLRSKGEEQISIRNESGIICRIRNEVSGKPLGEDDEWNAMLIAAAPRMYEYLRNLDGYDFELELLRAFWFLVYFIKAVLIGVSAMRHECLGSRIRYAGQPGYVTNWAGGELPALKLDDGTYIRHADRSKIVNVRSIREYAHRFRTAFRWWVNNWLDIYVNAKVWR